MQNYKSYEEILSEVQNGSHRNSEIKDIYDELERTKMEIGELR